MFKHGRIACLCILSLIVSVLISGCTHYVHTFSKDRVIFIDRAAARKLNIDSLSIRIVEDRTTEIQLGLTSKTGKPFNFSTSMKYYDSNDFEISYPNDHWEPRMILPRQSMTVRKILPDNRLHRVEIYLQSQNQ